jgi:hypothetical protein
LKIRKVGLGALRVLSALTVARLQFQDIETPEVELFVTLGLLNYVPKRSPSVILMCGLSDGPLIEFHRILWVDSLVCPASQIS